MNTLKKSHEKDLFSVFFITFAAENNKNHFNMAKVIAFLRVSTKGQDLEPQRKEVIEAIMKDGFSLEDIVTVEGKESAIKLDEDERKTLIEMNDIISKDPSIRHVYCRSIDRISRRMSTAFKVYEELTKKGINLVVLSPQRLESFTNDGKENGIFRMILIFLTYMADIEMKIKGDRFAAVREQSKKEGRAICSVSYGYYIDENKFIKPHPKESQVVHWVHKTYLEGKSLNWIYREGVRLGYWDEVNGLSGGSKIRRMLTTTIYIGKPTEKGVVYPQIIDEKMHDAVNMMLKKNRNVPKSVHKHEDYFLCRRLVIDAETSLCLIGIYRKKCYKMQAKGRKLYSVNAEMLHEVVFNIANEINGKLIRMMGVDELKGIDDSIEYHEIMLKTVEEQVNEYDQKFDKAYDAYVASGGRITKEKYEKTVGKLTKELDTLKNNEAEIRMKLNDYKTLRGKVVSQVYDNPEETADIDEAKSFKMKRDIVERTIDRIMVYDLGDKKRKIEIIPKNNAHVRLITKGQIYTYVMESNGRKKNIVRVE